MFNEPIAEQGQPTLGFWTACPLDHLWLEPMILATGPLWAHQDPYYYCTDFCPIDVLIILRWSLNILPSLSTHDGCNNDTSPLIFLEFQTHDFSSVLILTSVEKKINKTVQREIWLKYIFSFSTSVCFSSMDRAQSIAQPPHLNEGFPFFFSSHLNKFLVGDSGMAMGSLIYVEDSIIFLGSRSLSTSQTCLKQWLKYVKCNFLFEWFILEHFKSIIYWKLFYQIIRCISTQYTFFKKNM